MRATYRLLAAGAPQPAELAAGLAELGRRLLPADALPRRRQRLVVVGDGPIRFAPLALLPDPGDRKTDRPAGDLLLPSLSVLASLRTVAPYPRTSGHDLAVVADPLLAPAAEPLQGPLARAFRGHGLENLIRLPFPASRRSGCRSWSWPARLALLEAAARRDSILEGFLTPYRVVHFATHGLFDAQDVHRSGLVLAQRDAAGNPLEGFSASATSKRPD